MIKFSQYIYLLIMLFFAFVRCKDDNSAIVTEIDYSKPKYKIALDSLYAGSWTLIEDINNDGLAEVLTVKNRSFHNEGNDNHFTTCVTAYTLRGDILWQWGDANLGRNGIHHDVACQVIDWNKDNENEVVLLADQRLVVLNGRTGNEERSFQIPKDASDCLIFGNFSENKYLDVLVKNRYTEVYAFSYNGSKLWEWKSPTCAPPYLTAHFPLIGDWNADGIDDVLIGFIVLDNKGVQIKDLLNINGNEIFSGGHLDAARYYNRNSDPNKTRIVITGCGANFIAMIDGNGKILWIKNGLHYESINIANTDNRFQGDEIIVDIDHSPWGDGKLNTLDYNGNVISEITTNYSRFHAPILWDSKDLYRIAVGESHTIYNELGAEIIQLIMPNFKNDNPSIGNHETICYTADVDKDKDMELVIHYTPVDTIYIYESPSCIKNGIKEKFRTFY